MLKYNALFFALIVVALAVFNCVAFIPADSGSVLFRPAYVFTTAAFLLQFFFIWIAFSGADSMKKAFLGIPVGYVGFAYLAAQCAWGCAGLFASFVDLRLYVVVCAALFLFCVGVIILSVFGGTAVRDIGDITAGRTSFMKSLLRDMEGLCAMAEGETKQSITKLADSVRYSDPTSNSATAEVEERIRERADALRAAVSSKNAGQAKELCGDLAKLLDERRTRRG
jgi:cytochrome c556